MQQDGSNQPKERAQTSLGHHRRDAAAHRRPAEDHRHRPLRRRLQLPRPGLRRTRSAPPSPTARIQPRHLRRRSACPASVLVLHHGNIGPLFRIAAGGRNVRISESRPPFEDDKIYYWGQYIALVVAETFEQARPPPHAVKVTYQRRKAQRRRPLLDDIQKATPRTSKASAATPTPPSPRRRVQVDADLRHPRRNPQPDGDARHRRRLGRQELHPLRVLAGRHEPQNVMAQVLGIPRENVEVISRFIGSGFGGKLFPWPHSALAAAAAAQLNRPVKLTLAQDDVLQRRPPPAHAAAHAPRRDPRRQARLARSRTTATTPRSSTTFKENCGEATPFLYSVPNLKVTSALVRRNVGTPTPMRGPGAVPGLFALESAMDELAIKLNMDPVALRLKNDTLIDEEQEQALLLAPPQGVLEVGREKFGWSQRNPRSAPCAEGDLILGWGMAAASWGAGRGPCEADVQLCATTAPPAPPAARRTSAPAPTPSSPRSSATRPASPSTRSTSSSATAALPPGPTSGGSTATATVLPGGRRRG